MSYILLMFSNLNKLPKIDIYIILPMKNYIFVTTSLILVYVIYLIHHIVPNFSFFMFQMWFVHKLLYKCIKMLLFIVFSIKKVNSFVVTSLHQVEYKFML